MRPKSRKRADNDALVAEALKGIANKQWKSSYAAAKALGIHRSTIHRWMWMQGQHAPTWERMLMRYLIGTRYPTVMWHRMMMWNGDPLG